MNGRAVRTELTRLNASTVFFSLCLKHSDVWHLLGVDRKHKQFKKKTLFFIKKNYRLLQKQVKIYQN